MILLVWRHVGSGHTASRGTATEDTSRLLGVIPPLPAFWMETGTLYVIWIVSGKPGIEICECFEAVKLCEQVIERDEESGPLPPLMHNSIPLDIKSK